MKLSKSDVNLIEPHLRSRAESLEDSLDKYDTREARKIRKVLERVHAAQSEGDRYLSKLKTRKQKE